MRAVLFCLLLFLAPNAHAAQRVVYADATWISPFGAHLNHCGGELRLSSEPEVGGRLVLRFDMDPFPPGTDLFSVQVLATVSAQGSIQDVEVYRLLPVPSICATTWEQYASGVPWDGEGATGSEDHAVPALADQIGTGATINPGTIVTLLQGAAAATWVASDLEDGTGSLLVTCELGQLRFSQVRLVIDYY